VSPFRRTPQPPEAPTPSPEPWHALPPEEVLRRLGTDPLQGLPQEEARRRLSRWGPNELPEAPPEPWTRLLLRPLASPLVLILAVGAVLSLLVGEPVDALAILAILLFNTALGFVEEWRAERALESLRRMLTPTARTVREGHLQVLPARDLVPGDLVLLEEGDRVPADLRLLEAEALEADESALTGESVPVAKDTAPIPPDAPLADRRSMAWMGTLITRGVGRGVVVATGARTRFGQVAHLAQTVREEPTPPPAPAGPPGPATGSRRPGPFRPDRPPGPGNGAPPF